jgi:hypothetical protein
MKTLVCSGRSVLIGCAVTLGMAGCSSDSKSPASAGSPVAATSDTQALTAGGPDVKAQDKPNAVFRVVPGPSADGVIRGAFPLTVQFNNCQSRPTNEDDNLKFTYDFNGDGTVDEFGHCRWEHVYTENATARVCVSDRRPENEVCTTWEIAGGRASSARLTVAFTIDSINCGAVQPFEFFLNGVPLGAVLSPAPCACSVAANVGTFAFDSDIVAAAWNKGGSNTIRFVNSVGFPAGAAAAYVNVQVTRADGKSFTQCLDADGVSPCTGATACSAGPYALVPLDVSTVIVDN